MKRIINIFLLLICVSMVNCKSSDTYKISSIGEIKIEGQVYCSGDTIYDIVNNEYYRIQLDENNTFNREKNENLKIENESKIFDRNSEFFVQFSKSEWQNHKMKLIASAEGTSFNDIIELNNGFKISISFVKNQKPELLSNRYKLQLIRDGMIIDEMSPKEGTTAIRNHNEIYKDNIFYLILLDAGANDYTIILNFFEIIKI